MRPSLNLKTVTKSVLGGKPVFHSSPLLQSFVATMGCGYKLFLGGNLNLSNFFVMPRDLFGELKEAGVPCIAIFCEFLNRVRYNGNRLGLEIGQFIYSEQKLADELDLSRKQVRNAIAKLVNMGLISVEKRGQFGAQEGPERGPTGTIGSICDHRLFRKPVEDEGQKGATKGPEKGLLLTGPRPKEEHICNIDAEPLEEPLDDRIEAIYSRYPKRDGAQNKGVGITRLKRIFRESPQAIEPFTKAVNAYRAWCERQGHIGTPFVKQFSSFVNPEVWEEWVSAPQPKEQSELAKRMGIRFIK